MVKPIKDLEAAKIKYLAAQTHWLRRIKLPDYDVLKKEFESGIKTFGQIGSRFGLTSFRIYQIYKEFFSSHIPDFPTGRARQRARTRKKRKRMYLMMLTRFARKLLPVLRSIEEASGLEGQFVAIGRGGHVVSLAGRTCSVHVANKPTVLVPRFKSKAYWRFNLFSSSLKKSDFVILLAREGHRCRFFIFPSSEFPLKFRNERKRSNWFYIPKGGYDRQGRGKKRVFKNVFRFENAWYYIKPLRKPRNKETASAVSEFAVSSGPA